MTKRRGVMEHYKYFCNRECEFFPCHKNIDEKDFSCLFCYCPLYGTDCGGDGEIVNGVRDCSNCTIPHNRNNYDYIMEKLKARFEGGYR